MTWIEWPAPAKLNLFLRITGRRQDGYHCLQTVFRLLDWGDGLRLRLRTDGAIRRVAGAAGVSAQSDLTVRAATLLRERVPAAPGVDIAVDKCIPVGGGLGGGSSDAATVLVALNLMWEAGLDDDALASLGLELGADVPLFVRGRTAWAEGVGECLTPLELPPSWYVVFDPHVQVSTAALFQAPELTRNAQPATICGFLQGAARENAFEAVVRVRHPEVAAALDWLGGFGAARLSGSGGCVFLETATRDAAEMVAARCPPRFTAQVVAGVGISPLVMAAKRYVACREGRPVDAG